MPLCRTGGAVNVQTSLHPPPEPPRPAQRHTSLPLALRLAPPGDPRLARFTPARACLPPATSPSSTNSLVPRSLPPSTSYAPKATSKDASAPAPTSARRSPNSFCKPRTQTETRPSRAAASTSPHYARRLPLQEEAGLHDRVPHSSRVSERWANGNPTLPRTTTNSPARAFRANQPALDQFPTDLWAQVATRRLRRVSTNLLAGGDPLGYRPLRQSVADYLNTSRGVKCTADQVLITSGVQEALDRVAHLLLNPDDPVWIENPGYPGAANAFHAVGARLCRVRVDAEGLDLRDGQRRHPRPRLVYVTPAHQFPLGITMSLRRRLELLEWARRQGVVIFEDDYDSEYRYSGRPVPAMQGLDRANMVIFAGSFSDVLFPALRLGYVVVPPDMIDIFAAAESVTTHHPPLIDQAILTDFIDAGHFARHVRRMRNLYADRLGVLLEEGRSKLAGFLEFPEVEAGLRTVVYVAKDAHVAAGVSPTGGPDRVAGRRLACQSARKRRRGFARTRPSRTNRPRRRPATT